VRGAVHAVRLPRVLDAERRRDGALAGQDLGDAAMQMQSGQMPEHRKHGSSANYKR